MREPWFCNIRMLLSLDTDAVRIKWKNSKMRCAVYYVYKRNLPWRLFFFLCSHSLWYAAIALCIYNANIIFIDSLQVPWDTNVRCAKEQLTHYVLLTTLYIFIFPSYNLAPRTHKHFFKPFMKPNVQKEIAVRHIYVYVELCLPLIFGKFCETYTSLRCCDGSRRKRAKTFPWWWW